MGERNNIRMIDEGDSVRFYSHWDTPGALEGVVRNALALRARWNDFPYLNRIVFCRLVERNLLGQTGYGITSAANAGTDVIVVDVARQTIWTEAAGDRSFEAFVNGGAK